MDPHNKATLALDTLNSDSGVLQEDTKCKNGPEGINQHTFYDCCRLEQMQHLPPSKKSRMKPCPVSATTSNPVQLIVRKPHDAVRLAHK